VSAVPEPGTLLLGPSLIFVGLICRRSRRA
jgi:hypothetical protein